MMLSRNTRWCLGLTVLVTLALGAGCRPADDPVDADAQPATALRWNLSAPGVLDLEHDGRNVIRYMHAFDQSTDERAHETYKPYVHVFDGSGSVLLTKGPGGLYTHHRGIFIGYSQTRYDGRQTDFWHMGEGAVQKHIRFLAQHADEERAGFTALIHWIDPQGELIVVEERTITAYRVTYPMLAVLDVVSTLSAPTYEVELDGDPEHAGVQYRPSNAVADGAPEDKATYAFHADGIDPTTHFDLPWAASTYRIDGRAYAVQHLSHPDNPPTGIYSAYRDYGRFGEFTKHTIRPGEPLTLHHRIIVEASPIPPRTTLQTRYEAYISE
jgi:hypothetical protein